MRIVALIDNRTVIERILRHLTLQSTYNEASLGLC
jgi:hypothetical protein